METLETTKRRPLVVPNPNASPIGQMDSTSVARQDPANPMGPGRSAADVMSRPSAPTIKTPGDVESFGFKPPARGTTVGSARDTMSALPSPSMGIVPRQTPRAGGAEGGGGADVLSGGRLQRAPAGQPVGFAPGAFKLGRGEYSDNPTGMGFASGFTGRPNAQNLAAADRLSERNASRLGTAPMEMGGGNITPETSGSGFGLLDQGARDRRSAMMDAQQMKPGARTALAALLKRQEQEPVLDQRREEARMEQEGKAADLGLRREDLDARMSDAAATRDLRAQELTDNMRTNDVKRQAAGIELTAAQRLQSLQGDFLDASTPQERASAAQRLAALQGITNPTKNPAPPPGYRWSPDGQTMEAVPGGPADIKAGQLGVKFERQRAASLDQADRVIGMTNKAAGQVNNLSAGFIGSLAKGLPGSDARDLSSNLETVKANLGFAELQAMRDASPTGGALGAIAVQELVALQSTVASLDQSQSPAQLRTNLQKIGEHYQRWKSAVDQANNPDGQQAAPENVSQQPQAEGANTQASPAQTTEEQWSQLPAGALYIAPDGSTRRKK